MPLPGGWSAWSCHGAGPWRDPATPASPSFSPGLAPHLCVCLSKVGTVRKTLHPQRRLCAGPGSAKSAQHPLHMHVAMSGLVDPNGLHRGKNKDLGIVKADAGSDAGGTELGAAPMALGTRVHPCWGEGASSPSSSSVCPLHPLHGQRAVPGTRGKPDPTGTHPPPVISGHL